MCVLVPVHSVSYLGVRLRRVLLLLLLVGELVGGWRVEVAAAGAGAGRGAGGGAGVVEMAGADVVATAAVEGAGGAVADLGAAGGSADVVDSAAGSVGGGGPAENGGLAGDGGPVAGEVPVVGGAPAAAGSVDSGPRCSAGRRTPLQPTAAARRESRAATEGHVVSSTVCSAPLGLYTVFRLLVHLLLLLLLLTTITTNYNNNIKTLQQKHSACGM